MTSVLYGAGLNYQRGNPVRQEIVDVRRDVDIRKQIDQLTEENLIYRKHLMKLLQKDDSGNAEFTRDLMSLAGGGGMQGNNREPGGGTVQGAGFRR